MSNFTLDDIIDIVGDEIARLDKRIDKLEGMSNRGKNLTSKERQEICESKESVKFLSLKYHKTRQQIYNIRRKGNQE